MPLLITEQEKRALRGGAQRKPPKYCVCPDCRSKARNSANNIERLIRDMIRSGRVPNAMVYDRLDELRARAKGRVAGMGATSEYEVRLSLSSGFNKFTSNRVVSGWKRAIFEIDQNKVPLDFGSLYREGQDVE